MGYFATRALGAVTVASSRMSTEGHAMMAAINEAMSLLEELQDAENEDADQFDAALSQSIDLSLTTMRHLIGLIEQHKQVLETLRHESEMDDADDGVGAGVCAGDDAS